MNQEYELLQFQSNIHDKSCYNYNKCTTTYTFIIQVIYLIHNYIDRPEKNHR